MIGTRIRQARLNKGYTLEEVASKIGITRQTLQKYETGVISAVPSDKIEAIAGILRISPAYLMGWEDEKGGEPKLSPNRRALLELAETASDEQISMLLRLAKAVLEEQEK